MSPQQKHDKKLYFLYIYIATTERHDTFSEQVVDQYAQRVAMNMHEASAAAAAAAR